MPTIPENIKKILENENLPSDSSSFLSSVTSKLQTEQDPFFSFFTFSEERKISFLCDFSGIQDSFCFRAKRRALLLSSYLIDEKGKFQAEKLPELLKFWEKEGNIFYPGGYNDEA
ncbi:MAG: hypothetical protein HKM07_00725, partial [Chlamydiae bacterium]|nr:hypothetical protein [Chlamydiota bacterium]